MFDAFGNPLDDNDSLVAASSRWTAGGNSAAARRARVALQRRDRYGRWAEMGGGISFWGRLADGSVVRMIGRYIGPAQREGYMRVLVAKGGRGFKPGVYEVPSKVATAAKAIISEENLAEAGIDFDVNGNRIGEVLDRDIETVEQMFKGEANSLDNQLATDNPLDEAEKAVQVKARLAEAPHVSYNVVDEDGNPVEQAPVAEAPQAPQAPEVPQLPRGIVENRSESMTLYQSPDGAINPIQVISLGGGKAWQVTRNAAGQNPVVLSTHPDRESAENSAKGVISRGEDVVEAPEAPQAPVVSPAPATTPTPEFTGFDIDEIPADILQEMVATRIEEGTFWSKPDGSTHPYSVMNNFDGSWAVYKNGNQNVGTYSTREDAETVAIEQNANDVFRNRPVRPAPQNPVAKKSASVVSGKAKNNIQSWIDQNLESKEDLIDENLLTSDSTDPETGNRVPGGKTMFRNLKQYRASLISALKEAAFEGKDDDFAYRFALAKRMTAIINAMYKNQQEGKPAEQGLESLISTKDPNKKLATFQIIPSSIRTSIGTEGASKGKTVIDAFNAVHIAKDGKPYMYQWTRGEIYVRPIKGDGTVDTVSAAHLSYSDAQQRGLNGARGQQPEGSPNAGVAGSIQTARPYQAIGLASGMVYLNRWIAERIGSRYSHSSCLRPNGNFYSKTISRDMRDHDRTQADKAIHQNNPNGTIFKVMKQLGWVDGQYKPYDRNARVNDGGTGWLKRITIDNTGGNGSNMSKLDDFTLSLRDELVYVRERFSNFADTEKQRIISELPEIFADFIKGETTSFDKWDVQYNLLSTVYSDGMSKDQAVSMLEQIIDGREKLKTLFGGRFQESVNIRKLQSLLDTIRATEFKPEDNAYTKPIQIRVDAIRNLDTPFAGFINFSSWSAPDGVKPLTTFAPFNPRRATPEDPSGWTENPVELARKFSSEQLLSALRDSLVNNRGESATLKFGANNDEDGSVSPDAIFKALEQQGQDASSMLAGIYDEILGEPKNKNALDAARMNTANISEVIQEYRNQIGELDSPIAFDAIGGRFSETNGVLNADIVKRGELNIGGDASLDLRTLNPNNTAYNFAPDPATVGVKAISSEPYTPQIPTIKFYTEGITDNPKLIARNFSTSGLTNALQSALNNRKRTVKLEFSNGNQVDVAVEAIRDALQHQGVDTEQLLKDRANLVIPPRRGRKVFDSGQDGLSRVVLEAHNPASPVAAGQELARIERTKDADGNYTNLEYAVVEIPDPDNSDTNPVAKLVKVTRNADGKYEVKVAARSENYIGDWSDRPVDGVYDSISEANHDLIPYIQGQNNLESVPNIFDQIGTRRPPVDSNYEVVGELDESNPSVEIDGITVSKPDGVISRKIYATSDTRIPTAVRNGANGKYVVVDDSGDNGEAFYSLAKNDAGDGFTEELIASYSLQEDGLNYKVVRPSTGTIRTVASKEIAAAWAKYQALTDGKLVNIPGIEPKDTYAQIIKNAPVVLTPSSTTVSEDNTHKTMVIRFVGRGGQLLEAVMEVKKGAHPAWRNGFGGPDNNWIHATVSVKRQGASASEAPLYTGKVYRRNSRSWVSSISRESHNQIERDLFGGQGLGSTFLDTKTEAHTAFSSQIQRMLGLQPDDDVLPDVQIIDAAQARRDAQRRRIEDERIARERVAQEVRERLEAERVAREIAAANNAGDVDVIPGSLMTEEQFQEFCRQRGMLVDLRGKINHGEIGRGISNSEVWETRDGKRYKVKKSQSDNKSRNESLMHAIWLAMGVQATEGGLGEFVNGAGVTRVVLADRFQDGILPRDAFWPNAFSDANFRNPAYQQAIADLHEGLLLDVLQGQWDLSLNGNSGNAFLVVKDGVIRGVRCDGGTGGPYGAGNDRSNGHFDAPPIEFMERIFGRGFLNNGRIAGSSQEGNWNRGLTLDALKAIARRTILPLTDQRIDALVNAIITDPRDNAELRVKLQQRRLKILEAFGIDPNEQPPVGTAARVPQAIPGVRVPTLQDDGYEYGPVLPNGKKTVKLRGTVRADGIFVPENYANLPIEVRNGIESGELLPENLPFMSEAVPSNGLPLDANGMPEGNLPVFVGSDGIRRISPFGAVSLFIRKRDRNGNYVYLGVRPSSLDAERRKLFNAKIGPLHIGKKRLDQTDPTAQEVMRQQLGMSIEPVSVKSFTIPIPGAAGDHRIMIADIGDQDLDLGGNLRVGDAYWNGIHRYEEASDRYWGQFDGQLPEVLQRVREYEANWSSSPTNVPNLDPDEPAAGDGGQGGTGTPPTPTPPQGPSGGASPSDENGWQAIRHGNIRDAADNVVGSILVSKHEASGSYKAVNDMTGETLGKLEPTYHGHWAATFMPDEITGRDGNNRNGSAVKAIFKTKEEADNWLGKMIHDKYGSLENRRRSMTGQPYNPNVVPEFAISKGFLNETTQDQRDFANRLIENKVATPEERALYRAILTQDKLTVGEVGWVIGQLRDREDRDPAEVQASQDARNAAVVNNPIVNTNLTNVAPVGNTRAVRAKDLAVGNRILGNVNGNVVFAAEGDNDTLNVGVVGDDGKLRVYKVNRNSVIAIDNAPAQPAPQQQQAPLNPGIAARRQRARLIQDAIKAEYPNFVELPNGDLVIGQRNYRAQDGTVHRLEAVVHKLQSDEFVTYIRKQELDSRGNPVGTAVAAYFTNPFHSPLAVSRAIQRDILPVMSHQNPLNGFNQKPDRVPEVLDPATGQMLPARFVQNRNAQFIGETGIEKTGNPAKDALISYIHNLVSAGVANPDIIRQIAQGNQRLFSEHQLRDIVERVEANRIYPGVNAIPYVSKDNRTIVREGDRVVHYDADGNVVLGPNGQPRTGTVVRRLPYVLNRKAQGNYEYTDKLYVQFDGERSQREIAARRLEVTQRADGSAPVPAVRAENGQDQPGGRTPEVENLPEAVPANVVPEPQNAPAAEPVGPVAQKVAEWNAGRLPQGYVMEAQGENGAVVRDSDGNVIAAVMNLNDDNARQVFLKDPAGGGEIVRPQSVSDAVDVAGAHAQDWEQKANLIRNGQPAPAPEPALPTVPEPSQPAPQRVDLPPNTRVDDPAEAARITRISDDDVPRNRYEVVRDEDGTRFVARGGDNDGSEAFVTVVKTQNGWMATDPRELTPSARVLYNGPDRNVAEMRAINRITGADGGENPVSVEPSVEPTTPNVPQPSTPSNNAGQEQVDVLNLDGREVARRTQPDGSADYYYDGNLVGSIERTPDGKYRVVDQFSGEVYDFDNEAEARERVEQDIAMYGNAGLLDTQEQTPPTPNNPIPNIQPQAPVEIPQPQAPEAPAQGRPRVNKVQPGDRYVKFNFKRSGVDGQGPNYWEIRDRKTNKVIARAQDRQVADEIAAGIRDLNGKLIDFQTPVAPRQAPAKAPRPNGYKRTAVGQGYFLENPNDPNAPVARVEFDRDQNKWVGKLYANKQDAEAQRNPIGSEISDASQNSIESKANEAVQGELDRRNPPAPAPVAPAQPQASSHIRTNLSQRLFFVHKEEEEQGVATQGDDGKWNIRVHENPRDALDNRNPFATGSYDTPEEAEAAIRQAIADRKAQQNAANVLQWQSGSDGVAYLGLDGVPGLEGQDSPVWAISPMPFGAGWIMGAWGKKSDRDAGLPPSGTSRHENEQEAKDFAQQMAQNYVNARGNANQAPAPVAPAPAAPAPVVDIPPATEPPAQRMDTPPPNPWNNETPPWLA